MHVVCDGKTNRLREKGPLKVYNNNCGAIFVRAPPRDTNMAAGKYCEHLAPVVQRLVNAIHWINHYPADSVVCFVNTYPLDSDLSDG